MPLIPVMLWTDALVFILLALGVGFGIYAAQHEHLRAPWRQVLHTRTGVITLLVLSSYALLGILDTVHLRLKLPSTPATAPAQYAPEVVSLLDLALHGLRERQEKTYSAPLATHLFTKEVIEQPDGTLRRDYPRLLHGGRHLTAPASERSADLFWRSLRGAVKGLASWALLTGGILWLIARRRSEPLAQYWLTLRRSPHLQPGRTALITLAVLMSIGFIAAELAAAYHLFGTDKVGEDVFYQALKSVRTGLLIGTLTTLVMLPAALLLGIAAGYFRGWVDDLIQYLYTTLNSIPGVLLIAAAILLLQVYLANHANEFTSAVERADLRLLFLCLILGVTSWTGLCRLLRGEALKLREVDYVQAAQALGVGHFTIITRHLLPNMLHIVLITVVLDFSGLVLAEAVLSYVNIGVDPTMNSWGNMINSARLELAREPVVWWSLTAAFIFMFVLVLAANLFADVVRDAFDPRLRQNEK